MNRKAIPIILVLALLMLTVPLVAFAADSLSMDVEFTLTESDVGTPTTPGGGNSAPEPTNPPYIINIPASINLNDETEVVITWVNNSLVDLQNVIVSIDGARTFPDGTFYLTCGDGGTPSHRVACNISRGYQTITGPDDAVVAEFFGGSASGPASTYGKISFSPTYSLENVAGTYTGTVHFKINFIQY